MSQQIIFGLIAEGTTDIKFLRNVITRTVNHISWECDGELDVYDVQIIPGNGYSFVEKMTDALRKAYAYTHALCIHADADGRSSDIVLQNKFNPLYEAINAIEDIEICRVIVPTIPIQMIEAWMLADKPLLKRLINADRMTDMELSLERPPEQYSNPKAAINEAIRISMSTQSKRRRDQISINDLYETLGNSISISALENIPSFCAFEENVRQAFRQLNLLH